MELQRVEPHPTAPFSEVSTYVCANCGLVDRIEGREQNWPPMVRRLSRPRRRGRYRKTPPAHDFVTRWL